MKAIVLFACLWLSGMALFAQTAVGPIWTPVSEDQIRQMPALPRIAVPERSFCYALNFTELRKALEQAPVRSASGAGVVIPFPTSAGQLQRFRVMESPVMHPGLAARYPVIKTYCAQGIDDPGATMRFSITRYGLHAIIFSGKMATNYIDPYSEDQKIYTVYDRASIHSADDLPCLLDEETAGKPLSLQQPLAPANTDDRKLRTFRLALSCTAEYGNFFAIHPGTEKADILAAMVVALNRINGIYERDLSVTMQLVPNNDTLLFYGDPAADPWPDVMNSNKTAENHDAYIGVANYDIGHNFNDYTGGNGGCIACVCQSQNVGGLHKGRGYTGISTAPVALGDPFIVDLVAHEMGHQFGGFHTMNRCSRFPNSTGPQYVGPGSGNTIMGYAPSCYPHVQPHSDDEFHYVNIQAISANLQSGYGTCGLITDLSNHPPTADAGKDHTIPHSTAFVLEGTATDEEGLASLTYVWAEDDTEESPSEYQPKPQFTQGPLYRCFKSVHTPNRYMPGLSDVIAHNLTPTWEVTPSVARTLKFSFLVRDNDMSGGQTASDVMVVTVDSVGPFRVTSQNVPSTWIAGTGCNITWDVAGTNAGAVNTPFVDIFLSLDGGYTYPIVLATHVPNNGFASAVLPEGITTGVGKVMVRGAENLFFALNYSAIRIEAPEFNLSVVDTMLSVCPPGVTTFNLTYRAFLNFQDTTVFSASGLPPGATLSFDPSVAVDNNTPVHLTISGLTTGMIGNYPVTITGTSNNLHYTTMVLLHVLEPVPTVVTSVVPAPGAVDVALPVALTWVTTMDAGTRYDVDVATDPDFNSIVASASDLSAPTFTMPMAQINSNYFWRIRGHNPCGTSTFSSVFAFKTGTCITLNSTDVPQAIPEIGTPSTTIVSELNVPFDGIVTDVNVRNLHGTHTWIHDLTAQLTSPQNTTVILWTHICGNQDNFDLNLDDAATPGPLPCPPVGGGNYRPQQLLSSFNGEQAQGAWKLSITDSSNPDGGTLDGWGLQICTKAPVVSATTPMESIPVLSVLPNPNAGVFTLAAASNTPEIYQVRVFNSMGQQLSDFNLASGVSQTVHLENGSAGVYWVHLYWKGGFVTKKVVVRY
jgi:subtilisin-like proprotein convertase family protein